MSLYGPLEERVLEALWQGGEASVRQVLARLHSEHAYTTILTVLDRLHTKGVVQREKRRASWIYTATSARAELIGREVARLLLDAGPGTEPLLAGFLDEAESLDPDAIDRLEALIRTRRAERGG
jgi:predicted transcriptional regulator